MIKSVKKTRKEIAMPFSTMALAERQFANEIIESDSIRLIPTIRYKSATLLIVNTIPKKTHHFTENERISLNLTELTDGIYNYELTLVLDEGKFANKAAHLKGKFVMRAGFSREFNSKWLPNKE